MRREYEAKSPNVHIDGHGLSDRGLSDQQSSIPVKNASSSAA
jgi:hypothetical protein